MTTEIGKQYSTQPAGHATRVVRNDGETYKPVAIFYLPEDADHYVALMNKECPFCGEELGEGY